MCGRYFLSISFIELIKRYEVAEIDTGHEYTSENGLFDFRYRGNWGEIFPAQKAPVVTGGEEKKLLTMKWGFLPSFAKKPIINARGETVEKKSIFKSSFFSSRCLIPAQAFYEWEKTEQNKKIKRKIKPKNTDVFSLAGIFAGFKDDNNNSFKAFSILTVDASPELQRIHDRMPVILEEDEEKLWINPEIKNTAKIKKLIKPYEGRLIIE